MPQFFDTEGVREAKQFPDLTLEDMLFRFKDEISQERYSEEVQTLVTVDGVEYPINKESIFAMDSKISSLADDDDVVKWKAKFTYVDLTKQQLVDIANICKQKVQSLYDKEAQIYDLIDQETYDDDTIMEEVWANFTI